MSTDRPKPKPMWGPLALSLTLLVSGGLVWGMGSRVPAVGTPVEDFRLPDLDGNFQSLSQYRGNIVLINFWATWCKGCTMEMPAMQATYTKLHDKGFVVLAINELEDDATARKHIEHHSYTYPVLMDRDNTVANQFGVYGLPVSVFIDEKGIVQQYIKGALLTEEKILDVVVRIQKHEPRKAASLR